MIFQRDNLDLLQFFEIKGFLSEKGIYEIEEFLGRILSTNKEELHKCKNGNSITRQNKRKNIHIDDFFMKPDYNKMDKNKALEYFPLITDMDDKMIREFYVVFNTMNIEDSLKAFDVVIKDFIYCLRKGENKNLNYSSTLILTS